MDEKIVFDELNGEEPDNQVHIDRMLFKVGKLEREIKEIENSIIESKEFYERRIEAIRQQIHARELIMESYALSKLEDGVKTNKFPNGTLRVVNRIKRTLPDDETLLSFSYDNRLPTKVIEKPDKKSILEYIKTSGDTPEGYEESEVQSFLFKTN